MRRGRVRLLEVIVDGPVGLLVMQAVLGEGTPLRLVAFFLGRLLAIVSDALSDFYDDV
jgi:hypothetical protein